MLTDTKPLRPWRIFSALLLLSALTACAVMDTNSMESAVPLPKNKIDVQAYTGTGIDLSSVAKPEYWDENAYEGASSDFISAYKLAIGVGNDSEIGLKAWTAALSAGARGYYKKRFYHVGKRSFAIAPGLTLVISDDGTVDLDNLFEDRNHRAIGFEIPLIFTYEPNDNVYLSSAIRANHHLYWESVLNDDNEVISIGPTNITHYSFHQNATLHNKYIFITPEVGLIMITNVRGRFIFVPSMAFGLGIRL
ncbi:MAG: hypothetical protein Q8M98_07810 [Candidatus Cloacimonadaceae bacterium]|nr:hypothetical protein [Candidatus Cloacimonadaceae bacterium]MDP3114669.1 hypothetical protein [Candidatus Cloacimonadaceae bacterium]